MCLPHWAPAYCPWIEYFTLRSRSFRPDSGVLNFAYHPHFGRRSPSCERFLHDSAVDPGGALEEKRMKRARTRSTLERLARTTSACFSADLGGLGCRDPSTYLSCTSSLMHMCVARRFCVRAPAGHSADHESAQFAPILDCPCSESHRCTGTVLHTKNSYIQ